MDHWIITHTLRIWSCHPQLCRPTLTPSALQHHPEMVRKKRHGLGGGGAQSTSTPQSVWSPGRYNVALWGNSIGTMSLRHLQKFMKVTIVNIQNALPNSKIVWSQILPRNYYRRMFSHHAAEKARVRINSSLSNFIMSNKRSMGHIAHLSSLGQYRNIFFQYSICISFPFAPSDPTGQLFKVF